LIHLKNHRITSVSRSLMSSNQADKGKNRDLSQRVTWLNPKG